MNFGERLRSLRNENGLTLRQLSERLNITYSALGKYERNEREPDFETLEKIATYFGVMIDYLIGRTEIKTFDEFVFITDVRHLEDKLKDLDPKKRKLIVDIFDSTYLIVNRIIDEDVAFLQTTRNLFSLLNRFNVGPKSLDLIPTYVKNRSLSSSIGNLDSSELLKYISYYKNEINTHMDELMNLYITHEKDAPQNRLF
ncbi:helix-turn-helix transcriptional regulator [Brevibacillus laterosporus]|uniref:helix-turn-helix domain-containing protein n=1 Tax=Brevibacillus laterosporus TaxID=1465 RepID=UPI002E1A2E9F|nr:helix-turn-helix transcriptional regulator [Brevibacillus laterosporus]